MNHSDRHRKADDLAELAARISGHLDHRDGEGRTVIDRIREAMNGQPKAQKLEGDRTTGFTTTLDENGHPIPAISDPTGEAAIRFDRAAHDLRRVDKLLHQAWRAVEDITDLFAIYTPRPATDYEQRQLDIDNEPGCQSCSRVDGPNGKRWEPVQRSKTNPGANLSQPMDLCRWCLQFVYDTGRLPTEGELALHHSGQRVKRGA